LSVELTEEWSTHDGRKPNKVVEKSGRGLRLVVDLRRRA
jgi:hypothetical protein